MKKTIANLLFLVACVAGIIFLLLPFLETTPPATTQLKSVEPQISSSNPLATIANRLASLFGHPAREKRTARFSPRNSYDYTQPEWVSVPPTPQTRAAQAHAKSGTLTPPSTVDGQSISVPSIPASEYGDASLLTDDGEWVLIRQTSPQNGAPGMHEINVHENPYDKYIKQEQARRFHPAAQQADIPDHKWARLLRPVKEFLGITGSRPVGNNALAVYREVPQGASLLAYDKNNPQTASRRLRLPWPDITPAQWSGMSDEQRERERERRSTAEFVEIMSGTRSAEDAAYIEAMAKYPDPKDEDKRESYQRRLTEQNKQAIKAGLLEAMRAKTQGKEAVDELEHIMSGCSNASLPKPVCLPNQQEEAGSLFSSNEVTASQEQSRQLFLEKTQYVMPNDLPLLPVLGPTTPETIANMSGLGDVEKTAEIYRFLYEKNNCASQNCYWIPNSLQSNQQLTDAFKLANTKLVTDPDNTYPTYKEDFVRYKLEQARKQPPAEDGENAPTEAQIRREAEKQFTDNAANWITVTGDQLNKIHQVHTLQAANPNNPNVDTELVIPYLTNPVYAEQMYHDLGDSPIFGYALEPLTSVESNTTGTNANQVDKQTVINTAQLIVPSLADNVNTAFEVMEGVTKHAVSEGTRAGINLGINQFNQSGQNWGDMLNAVKNRNARATPPGKK